MSESWPVGNLWAFDRADGEEAKFAGGAPEEAPIAQLPQVQTAPSDSSICASTCQYGHDDAVNLVRHWRSYRPTLATGRFLIEFARHFPAISENSVTVGPTVSEHAFYDIHRISNFSEIASPREFRLSPCRSSCWQLLLETMGVQRIFYIRRTS